VAEFAVVVRTDDAKDVALYGEPYDAEGMQAALEAAFSQNGLEVVEIRELPSDGVAV
jgi:hypothetical protein